MTDNLAYVAGLIDGDGCIDLEVKASGRPNPSYYLRVRVAMTDPALPVLKWLHQEWGGSLGKTHRTPEKRKALWSWSVNGEEAGQMLRQVSPYLKVKAPQARLGLEAERIRTTLPRRPNGSGEWTSHARAECEAIKTKIHHLNMRGPYASNVADSFLPSQPLATWNPQAQLWETTQIDLFSGRQEPYSETFPTSFMMRGGRLFPLPPSARRTVASGSSSSQHLPTPRAEERMQHNSRDAGVALSKAVTEVLPTPQSNSVRASRRAMTAKQWTHPGLEQAIEIAQGQLPREFESWDEVPGRSRPETESLLPTPITGDAKAVRNKTANRSDPDSRHHDGETLTDAVVMLPSPRATDGTKGGPNQHGSSGDLMLPSAVLRLEE